MILIIGGFAQGKLHYVKQSYARCEDERKVAVLNGTLELPAETGALQVIVNHLPLYPGAAATGNRSGGNDRAFLQGTSGLHSDL